MSAPTLLICSVLAAFAGFLVHQTVETLGQYCLNLFAVEY